MKAIIITYTTESIDNTQKSIISKKINGYTDKSNKGQYEYKRKGLLTKIPHIKITKKTYLIKETDYQKIKKELKKLKVNTKTWNININNL